MRWIAGVILGWCTACTHQLSKDMAKAQELLYAQDYGAAELLFRSVVEATEQRKDQPHADALHCEALYQLGLLHSTFVRSPSQAATELSAFVDHCSTHNKHADGLMLLADVQADGVTNRAASIQTRLRFLKSFPTHPKAPDVHLAMIRTHMTMEQYEQARQEAEKMAKAYPKHPLAAEARFMEATALAMEERHLEAAVIFHALRDTPGPLGAQAALEEGNSYMMLSAIESARDAFEAALKSHPNPLLVRHQLTRLTEKINPSGQQVRPVSEVPKPKPQGKNQRASSHSRRAVAHGIKDLPVDAVETAIDAAAGHEVNMNNHSDHTLDALSATTP